MFDYSPPHFRMTVLGAFVLNFILCAPPMAALYLFSAHAAMVCEVLSAFACWRTFGRWTKDAKDEYWTTGLGTRWMYPITPPPRYLSEDAEN